MMGSRMQNLDRNRLSSWRRGGPRRRLAAVAALLLWCALTGCAALTNPVANGIPAHRLPEEFLAQPKENQQTIPLTLLRRKPPEVYRLAPGDVLGVYIQGVLGKPDEAPPVFFPEGTDLPPALGIPIPIRENGTLPVPLVAPVRVEGLTIAEAEQAIIAAYTATKRILQPGTERIIVTLMRPRQTRVLVIRQDSPGTNTSFQGGGFSFGGGGGLLGGDRQRGAGYLVDLPADQNDVLHALAETGGLPGLNAANEVIIQRGYFNSDEEAALFLQTLNGCPPGFDAAAAAGAGGDAEIIRIPLRLAPGELPPFSPEDVILRTGDIVFIEARDAELFYAGGLLPRGQYPLPRDYDLDVVEAIAAIGGPLVNGGFGGNNLSGAIVSPGIGSPSPSGLTVLRRTPGGGQVPIQVDLNLALRDPRERILVQPGDVLILQETPDEAIVRYATQTFNFTLISDVIRTSRTTGTAALSVP